jgi:hypothetical protein
MTPSTPVKLLVLCTDQDNGKYVAMLATDAADTHGEGYSPEAAIVDFLKTAKYLEVVEKKHKHAFIGEGQDGDSCIYVMYVDKDGATGEYLPPELLQKIADRINNMKNILPADAAAQGGK